MGGAYLNNADRSHGLEQITNEMVQESDCLRRPKGVTPFGNPARKQRNYKAIQNISWTITFVCMHYFKRELL